MRGRSSIFCSNRISTTGLGFGFKIINNWSRGWRLEKCKFDFSDKSTLIFHKINFIIPFMRKYRNLVPEKVKMISRNDIKGLLSVWWPISREDLTILTFHVPSLAKGQGLCDIDSLYTITYSQEKYKKLNGPKDQNYTVCDTALHLWYTITGYTKINSVNR